MVIGTTNSGFRYEVKKNVANDMELLEALEEMSDENPFAMAKVCKRVFGEKQKKALYDHLRTEDGRVPVEMVSDAITEVFNAIGTAGKNS